MGGGMEQIRITDEALPILKSGMALKEKLLTVKAESYLKRLKRFEKKHKMKSAEFFEAFKAGKLGDDAEWFDWIFALNMMKTLMSVSSVEV
jgi:hypothetical protein